MKIMEIDGKKSIYPVKRYSEFEDLHNGLKHLIKAFGKAIELPALPKKHLFYWNED